MPWSVGQTLKNGQYTIVGELGQGGFGITYLAQDNLAQDKNKQYVVIKTLNDNKRHNPNFNKYEQDFLNEARRLAKCSSRQNPHPHIVQIYELFPEGNAWCMVMEYINEENLAHRVQNQGILSEDEALHYIQQIGSALTVVHEQGLLHRDVKPSNIMLRPVSGNFDDAVLIDFGIAREFTPGLIQTHSQIVSQGFAPIEQYEEKTKRGAYTDVYALAATLYFILTKKIPVSACSRAVSAPLELPRKFNWNISLKTERAILKGMAFQPDERPQTVQEWLEFLSFQNQAHTEEQANRNSSLLSIKSTIPISKKINSHNKVVKNPKKLDSSSSGSFNIVISFISAIVCAPIFGTILALQSDKYFAFVTLSIYVIASTSAFLSFDKNRSILVFMLCLLGITTLLQIITFFGFEYPSNLFLKQTSHLPVVTFLGSIEPALVRFFSAVRLTDEDDLLPFPKFSLTDQDDSFFMILLLVGFLFFLAGFLVN